MSDELPLLLFSSVFGLKVFSILTVVPRRGLQQCYNNTRGPDVGVYRPPRPQLWEMLWL